MSIANFGFYEYSQLLEKFMGINNFIIMGIEDFVISNYGNQQLRNIFMEFELWDKNTSKLWVSKSFQFYQFKSTNNTLFAPKLKLIF